MPPGPPWHNTTGRPAPTVTVHSRAPSSTSTISSPDHSTNRAYGRHRGQMGTVQIAEDNVEFAVSSDDEEWRWVWHPPDHPPPGTMHGAAAVCFDADRVVLISSDGQLWGLPGGRPEPGEGWVDTLRREVLEEACAVVTIHRQLGFCRAACVRGPQAGVVLVRAWFRATVRLNSRDPRHEINHRRLVTPQAVFGAIWIEDGLAPMYRRVFADAGLPVDESAR